MWSYESGRYAHKLLSFLSFETQWLTLRFAPELDRLHTAFKFVFFVILLPNLRPETPPSIPEFSTLWSLRSNAHDAIRDGKHERSEGTVTCLFFHTTRWTSCPPKKSKRNACEDRKRSASWVNAFKGLLRICN